MIKKAVFDLCKSVKRSQDRLKISSILKRPFDGEVGGLFVYHAHELGDQVGGYLALDYILSKPLDGNLEIFLRGIPRLSQVQLDTLREVAKEFVEIDAACIAACCGQIPSAQSVLDPYSEINLASWLANQPSHLVPEVDRIALSTAFETTLACKLTDLQTTTLRGYQSAGLTGAVAQINKRIREVGPHDVPHEIEPVLRDLPTTAPQRLAMTGLLRLVIIRSILEVVNQLFFQAITEDKLPELSDRNVIQIRKETAGTLCHGLTVDCTMDANAGLLQPGDIVMVHESVGARPRERELAQVADLHFNMSSETGHRVTISMRMLDDDLNPFNTLVRQL